MNKQIFSEEAVAETTYQPKQEFDLENVIVEEEAKAVEAELIIEESLKPSRFGFGCRSACLRCLVWR